MSMNLKLRAIPLAIACTVLATSAFSAESHIGPMREFAQSTARTWVADPVVINAIKKQNAKHADLSQADIDDLDKTWRAETGASDRPLIDRVLSSDLSEMLRDAQNGAQGLVTEVFVMDNRGLNVGQSNVTSDYWQGDEGKWQKTYLVGPDALFIDEVELDESTQTFQSQLSMSIIDPDTGKVIGAITVGINVDELL